MKAVRLLVLGTAVLSIAVAGCKSTPAAPSEPDKVVTEGVAAIKANKPANVYAMLPASYQADVQGVVTEGTSKIDKEIFELGVKVLDKAVVVLDKHGEEIGKSPMAKAVPGDFKEIVALVKEFHGILKGSGLTDYDKVKNLKVADFLADSGEKFMAYGTKVGKQFGGPDYEGGMKKLDGITAKTVKTEGDKAEVEITADGKTEKSNFVKIEGVWVPEEMTQGWKPMIENAKKSVGEGMAAAAANKEDTKKMLESILAALEAVEKDGKLDPLMQMGGMLN